ncbi:UDP-N-acetylenolpyruvoylglucosamine reductase [bacterium BMS3Abin03]|nr:UDP-N-acetylenolpyruvoylglucosamine reductase [bacterium BMS3Abin03]
MKYILLNLKIEKSFEEKIYMSIKKNHSLKELNTFGIDVKANYLAEIFSVNELKDVLKDSEFNNLPKLILGGGSNILFTKDFEGLILKISIPGINILDENKENVIVESGAGVVWNDLVNYCVEKKFGGIENLVLIPGTVGAAPIQNIGAYGQELKDTFLELSGVFLDSVDEKSFTNSECKFSYRNSIFKNELKDKFIVTSIKLRLKKNPEINSSYKDILDELRKSNISNPSIKDISNIVASIRRRKLPDPVEFGNAGSFFKNPVISLTQFEELNKKYPGLKSFPVDDRYVKISAAWLIEKCGWKGKQSGNVGTYHNQPLVLINYGNATGSEVFEFAMEIKESVQTKFGVTLQNEVNII